MKKTLKEVLLRTFRKKSQKSPTLFGLLGTFSSPNTKKSLEPNTHLVPTQKSPWNQTPPKLLPTMTSLTYNNSNGLYLVCPIVINKVFSHSTLELVQGVLVHVHTTFLSFFIYCMTHHQKSYVAKSTNSYLTTIRDALTSLPERHSDY